MTVRNDTGVYEGGEISLFYDPMSCKKINAGIADYLRANGFGNVTELVGTLS